VSVGDAAVGPAAAPHGAAAARRIARLDAARLRPVALPLATALAALVVWQLVVTMFAIPTVLLPGPLDVAREFARDPAVLLRHAAPTGIESLAAFVIATVLGVAIALVITYSPLLRDILYPNLVAFQLIPKIALAPLFVIWLGISSESRLAYATFISFFPVVISAAVGLATTERDALRLCRALTATSWQTFVMVRFPFALPYIFSGMKIAVTMAFIGIIVGEFISAKAGLGFYILYAGSRMETAAIFAAIFVLCAIGLVLYGAVAGAERLVRRWYRGW
jgi:NitT/TauT family transport system permease protein